MAKRFHSLMDIKERVGDARVAALIWQLLETDDLNVKGRAAEALGKIGDTRAVELLIQALKFKSGYDVFVQREVANALGGIGDTRAVEPLIQALEAKDDSYRAYVEHEAIEALGKIGDARAVEPLVRILNHSSRYIREDAAEALEKLGFVPKDDTEKAYFLIAKQDWDAVVDLGEPSIKPLMRFFNDEDEDSLIRSEAAEALGELEV